MIAEIAKANTKNGHHYLELVDTEQQRTTALMSATLWAGTYQNIKAKIGNDLIQILKPGNKVLCLMRIEYHKIYGLKLNIVDIDPSFSYGEVEKRKQETIKQLKTEGLFELQKDLYLPVISKRIGLVGSPDTAGFRDFLTKLESNPVYTNFKTKIFPTSVQGDQAATEIISALETAKTYDIDVIVIVRGGGSKMDLNVFNDYELAKAICKTQIPIITGIGHEFDEVVSDLVACQSCITPTAAAEFLYIQIGNFAAHLRQNFDAVLNHAQGLVSGHKDEFNHWHKYLLHHSKQSVLEYQWALNTASHRLQKGFIQLIQNQQSQLDLTLDKIQSQSLNTLHLAGESDLPNQVDRLKLAHQNYMTQRRTELNNLSDLLVMLNPKRLLESGYTITTLDDIDLNQAKEASEGKIIKTLTSDAVISSEIKTIKKHTL